MEAHKENCINISSINFFTTLIKFFKHKLDKTVPIDHNTKDVSLEVEKKTFFINNWDISEEYKIIMKELWINLSSNRQKFLEWDYINNNLETTPKEIVLQIFYSSLHSELKWKDLDTTIYKNYVNDRDILESIIKKWINILYPEVDLKVFTYNKYFVLKDWLENYFDIFIPIEIANSINKYLNRCVEYTDYNGNKKNGRVIKVEQESEGNTIYYNAIIKYDKGESIDWDFVDLNNINHLVNEDECYISE